MLGASLAGWKRSFTAEGLLFVPPEGPQVGGLRIRNHVQPLRSVKAIVDEKLARLPPAMHDVAVGPLKRVTTAEGEYAALINLTAQVGTEIAVKRMLGIVFADDYYVEIDLAVQDPARFAPLEKTVQKLVVNYSLGLGELRRRRYPYGVPFSWRGIARHRVTTFIPPSFPANSAVISVFDARPATLTPPLVQDRHRFEDLSGEFIPDSPQPPIPLICRKGLGDLLRLESSEAFLSDNRAVFLELVRSVEPPPTPTSFSPGSFIEWSD